MDHIRWQQHSCQRVGPPVHSQAGNGVEDAGVIPVHLADPGSLEDGVHRNIDSVAGPAGLYHCGVGSDMELIHFLSQLTVGLCHRHPAHVIEGFPRLRVDLHLHLHESVIANLRRRSCAKSESHQGCHDYAKTLFHLKSSSSFPFPHHKKSAVFIGA